MSKSKNDLAWERLFEKHKILEKILAKGHVFISSTEINEVREARLMTKFDHRSQLPEIFSENKLSILPTSRGSYVIGHFDTFCNFDTKNIEVTKIDFPIFLESLNYKDITSEATAINYAFASRMLHDFINEEILTPTVSGRMSSSIFDFSINSNKGLFKVSVENSQIEIDGGYEGDNSLILIEAKNYISEDFLIRQLYYPYKLWANKVNKQVRPIFLTYTNGIFHLREYVFDDIDHYNSLRLVKQKKYSVQDTTINVETIQQILESVETVKEPKIPFPQADNFERVVNLCELIKQNQIMSKEQYLQDFDFGTIDPRQHDYYTNAARYLGLVDKVRESTTKQPCYILSNLGCKIMSLSLIDKQTEFIKLILSYSAFRDSLKLYFDKGSAPDKAEIVEIMKHSKLYNIDSDSTYFRRASTITSWINWILDQIEE